MSLKTSMKKSSVLAGSAIAAAVAVLMATGPVSSADGPRGPGARMGERMAERIKDRCEDMRDRLGKMDRHLSADQLRDIIQGRLAQFDGGNLKVGKVTKKGDDVVALTITTKTGALVSTREFSTKTGMPVGAEDRCDQVAERISKAVARGGEGPGPGGPDGPRRGGRGPGRGPGAEGPGPGPGMGMGMARLGALGLIAEAGPGRDLNLTKDQARKLAEAGLIVVGNPNLKVGEIREKDADTYEVDIVAADNSLVLQRRIDRHTGRPDRGRD